MADSTAGKIATLKRIINAIVRIVDLTARFEYRGRGCAVKSGKYKGSGHPLDLLSHPRPQFIIA